MCHEDPHGPGLGSRLVTGLIYASLWPEELPLSPLFVLWEWAGECLRQRSCGSVVGGQWPQAEDGAE